MIDIVVSLSIDNDLRLTRYLRPWFVFYNFKSLRTAVHTIRRVSFRFVIVFVMPYLEVKLFNNEYHLLLSGYCILFSLSSWLSSSGAAFVLFYLLEGTFTSSLLRCWKILHCTYIANSVLCSPYLLNSK